MRISDWSSTCALPIYTLLVLDNFDAPDIQRARAEAERVGVRLAIAPVSEPKLSSLYKSSRALVRPDQLVAWRGDEWPSTGLLSFAAGKQIGSASCRERVCQYVSISVVAVSIKTKHLTNRLRQDTT